MIDPVGFGKALGIAIGGAEEQSDLLASTLEGDAFIFDILERIAGEEVQRRVEPQEFFDRRGDGAFARERCARVEAVFEHDFHPVADGVDGRFVARVQEQDHGRYQLVLAQFAAVAFGDKELADEIVAEVAARARA